MVKALVLWGLWLSCCALTFLLGCVLFGLPQAGSLVFSVICFIAIKTDHSCVEHLPGPLKAPGSILSSTETTTTKKPHNFPRWFFFFGDNLAM